MDIETIKHKVSVEPHHNGGANFKTHVLKKTDNGYSFKPSIGGILFASIFTLIGFAFVCTGIYKLFNTNFDSEYLFFMLFGALFLAAGLFLSYQFLRPRVFDKRANYYYKGFRKNFKRKKINVIPFNKIIAIQLIGETISSDNGSYKSFELNLVLDDISRLNVIDHGNLKKLIDDAEVLSAFLDVPIWHAESNKT